MPKKSTKSRSGSSGGRRKREIVLVPNISPEEYERIVSELWLVSFSDYRSDQIIDRLVRLGEGELLYLPIVEPTDTVTALVLIDELMNNEEQALRLSRQVEDMMDVARYRAIPFELRRDITYGLLERFKEARARLCETYNRVMEFIYNCARKYVWVRYLLLTPLYRFPIPLLALIVDPPYASILGTVHNVTNWAVGMTAPSSIKIKRGNKVEEVQNKNIRAKLHFTKLFAYVFNSPKFLGLKLMISKVVKRCYRSQPLEKKITEIYNKKLQAYGGAKRRTGLNTFRDLIEIFLMNSYLVWAYYYVQTQHYRENRPKLQLPLELLEKPHLVTDYLNPIDLIDKDKINTAKKLIPDIENITWKWLLETVQKQ